MFPCLDTAQASSGAFLQCFGVYGRNDRISVVDLKILQQKSFLKLVKRGTHETSRLLVNTSAGGRCTGSLCNSLHLQLHLNFSLIKCRHAFESPFNNVCHWFMDCFCLFVLSKVSKMNVYYSYNQKDNPY